MFSKTNDVSLFRSSSWGWTSVFGDGLQVKNALLHPFGVTLLLVSLGLAAAILLIESLEAARAWALVLAGIGIAGYVAGVVSVAITRPTPRTPEMRRLDSVRRMIKSKFEERKVSETRPYSPLTRTLGEAHTHLDRRIMPAVAELLEKQEQLARDLKSFEDGSMGSPDEERVERLKRMHARRAATIEECVQRASNAATTLIEMLQSDRSDTVAAEAEAWSSRILDTYRAIEMVMQGADDLDAESGDSEVPSRPSAEAGVTPEQIYDPLQQALRRLNPATNLIDCELADLLPCLIETRSERADSLPGEADGPPTPIERAQATRAAIVEAVETMRPGSHVSVSDPAAVHYAILQEQYVAGRPVAHIYMRLHIAESAYYRHRRSAITALAIELADMERRCRVSSGSHDA